MTVLHNLCDFIQSARAGLLAILASGFMIGVLWSGVDILWSHFSPGFGTMAQLFISPGTSSAGIQAVERFVLHQNQVHDVKMVSAQQGAKYIQEQVMQTQSVIDAEGLPVRLVIAFDGILSPEQKKVFERALGVFAQVDVVIFDHINSQPFLWGILGALFCFSVLALYFVMNGLRCAPGHSDLLYRDLLVHRNLGLRWSRDWVLTFVLLLMTMQVAEWALMIVANYLFYIPLQSMQIPLLFVLLMSVLWLKKTMSHMDFLVKCRYTEEV